MVPRLHVITDETLQDRYGHVQLAEHAVAGGADAVQFREKRPWSTRARLEVALRMQAVCADAVLVINDRLDIALATNAAVHLGLDDLPLDDARRLAPNSLMGATAHSVEEALAACAAARVDYLGVGPVYGTTSKTNPAPPLGLDSLAAIRRAVDVPLIAIGSITVERVNEVLDAGAHGVAVLSGIVCAADPQDATARYVEALGTRS